jgi:hypothetical protein
MAGRTAAPAVLCHRKVEFIPPLSVRHTFADVSVLLACVNGVAGPTRATALSIDVYVVQIKLAVSELRDAYAVLGGDHLASVALEAQLIVVGVERRIEQLGIGLSQEIEMGRCVRIVTGGTIGLPDGAVMIRIVPQQSGHILYFFAVWQGHFAIVAGQTRIHGRFLQELGQYGRMSVVAGLTLLALVDGAVDDRTMRNKPLNVLVTRHTELSRLREQVVGEIRAVGVMTFSAPLIQRRVNVAHLSVEAYLFRMTRQAQLIALGHEQVRYP